MTTNTWNLDEERRERKEKDDRHAPQIEVARCADLRRRWHLEQLDARRSCVKPYERLIHDVSLRYGRRANRPTTTSATTTTQELLWCMAIRRRQPRPFEGSAPPPHGSLHLLRNALLLLPLPTLRHAVKYNQRQQQQQQLARL